jgi:predicted RNA-binding protein YlxR (DUF448 family)
VTAQAKTSARQRTCVGCRRIAPSDALVRLTQHGGRVALADPHPVGRGAWLHPQPDCLAQATRRRALDRALRTRVSIDDDLRRRFTDVCDQRKAVR